MSRRTSLIRIAASVVVVGVGLLGLWSAGVLAPSKNAQTSTADGAALALQPANVGLQTPEVAGHSVGLSEGDAAPDFEFSAFDGRRMRLSDFRGRAVLLNFWATWCIPCKAELPSIAALLPRLGDDKLAVIGVNDGESFKQANQFITRLNVRLTAFGYDPGQEVVRRYSVQGLPISYFIDARGVVARVIAGQLTPKLLESGIAEALSGAGQPSN